MKTSQPERVHMALNDIEQHGLSCRVAASKYNVGRILLYRRQKGDVEVNSKNVPTPIVTPCEELRLLEAINQRAQHGHFFSNK